MDVESHCDGTVMEKRAVLTGLNLQRIKKSVGSPGRGPTWGLSSKVLLHGSVSGQVGGGQG